MVRFTYFVISFLSATHVDIHEIVSSHHFKFVFSATDVDTHEIVVVIMVRLSFRFVVCVHLCFL